MNFIKHHFLQKELLSLEAKLTRYYAVSSLKHELESKTNLNIFYNLWNRYLLNRTNIEYDSLSNKIPQIESRIYEIKSQLRDY